jgi:hypothetical protein
MTKNSVKKKNTRREENGQQRMALNRSHHGSRALDLQ